jgi:RPA family protein
LFLLGFGLSGVILQNLTAQFLGYFSHAGIMAIPSTIIGLYHMNIGGRLVHKYLPKDETQSISKNSFIGQTVTITTGHAQLGQPAEAKFLDKFGQMHYVMVEPDSADYSFNEGATALIIRQEGEIYRVVPNIDHLLANIRRQ